MTAALLASSLSTNLAERTTKCIDALGNLSGTRNAFTHATWHFPEGSGVATVWLDTWRKLSGKDPLVESAALIAALEKLLGELKGLELEIRQIFTGAQGSSEQDPLSMPLRQANVQTANSGLALQQAVPEGLLGPHQSSDQSIRRQPEGE